MRRRLRVALVVGGAMILARTLAPDIVAAQGLTVTGYADFEAWLADVDADDSQFYFDNHHVNLILLGEISGDLYAAVEVEYEHAGEEIALEYGYFGYTGFRDVRILAGKFIVPFGRFNKDLHPTPINKIPGRPHGFSAILPQTYNDVGIWVSGAKALNDDSRFVFDLFAVNGLLGEDGGGIRGLRDNDRERADFGRDDNKAVGARLGFDLPYAGFDVGTSVYTGKYAEDEAGDDLRLSLFGIDGSYQKNGFVLRAEIVSAIQNATGGDLSKTGGYVQASYQATPRVEPAVRFSARNMPGDASDARRLALGLNIQVAPASLIRLAYLLNMEDEGFDDENNTLVAQFNVFF